MLNLSHRPRRLRQNPWIRNLVAEHQLSVNDLIWPLFLIEGQNQTQNVGSMPDVLRYTIDQALKAVENAAKLGIPAIALFPNTPNEKRSNDAREAFNENNLICKACRAIKKEFPHIGIITDIALDPYTSHGHDGLLKGETILNDETVAVLVKQALVQAQAGADVIAPSDMMDGRIGAIREGLDGAKFTDKLILSYAAKYASSFYGPFRDAVGTSGTLVGDKRTYQMDYANTNEALREVALDLEEGADMVMVKPGMPYLDIIYRVKQEFAVPTMAYQVSGEYAMIKAAGNAGMIDAQKAMLESLTCFKRAGADAILTYFAIEVAQKIKQSS